MTMVRATLCGVVLLFLYGMVAHAQPVAGTTEEIPSGVVFTVRGILFNQDSSRIILTSPILLKIGEEKNLWSMDVAGGEGNVGSYTMQFRFNSVREFSEWYQTSAIQSLLRELKTGKGSYNASLSMRRAVQ